MATRTVRRWAFKKRAQQDVRRICKVWKLMPLGLAIKMAEEMSQRAETAAIDQSAKRCTLLANALHGIILGPAGQGKLEAYEWAAKVIRAPHWTPPQQVEQNAYRRAEQKQRELIEASHRRLDQISTMKQLEGE